MELLPKRTNLVEETASALKKWIEGGILNGEIPGEHKLKERLGVGRDTLRLALKLLEQDGWITAATQGCQRKVGVNRTALIQKNESETLPVTFLSPYPVVDRIILLEMEDLQIHLAEKGRRLKFLAPNIFHLKKPDRELEKMVHEQRSEAWVLYMATEAMQRWFEKRSIPAFIYGSPFSGVNLPYVVNDWEAGAFHAGIQLLRQRHRVIGLLRTKYHFPGMAAAERGLERALATINTGGRLAVLRDDQSPASVAKSLETAFAMRTQPTALVLTGSAQLLTTMSWLLSKGIRTPQDISLVCLPSDSWFSELYPPVCHYQCNSRVMARHIGLRVMELVTNKRVTRKSIRVRLEYMGGATIGRASITENNRTSSI